MLDTMEPLAGRDSSADKRSRPAGAPVLATAAVLGIYAVVVGAAGGSVDHVAARAGSDWPLLALAVAGALVPSLLAPRARRRWRSVLATALGALAAGVALTAAVSGGGHTLAELESALGVPLPASPGVPAAYAALAAVGLLVGACVSVHGATMSSSRSRSPARPT